MEPLETLKELLFGLCACPGTPGAEDSAAEFAVRALGPGCKPSIDPMGNVTAFFGNPNAERRILLDAHLDQIGLIVTGIDEQGFLHVAPCGGVDRRVLPGSPMTVLGKEKLTGVVCCLPPHLVEGGEEKVQPVDQMAVDIGLCKEEAEKLVSPGDRIVFCGEQKTLLGSRVTSPGLDDRAGCAVLLRAAELLQTEKLDNCSVTILLSSREETGAQGAKTAAYSSEPTEAVVVDVSFAAQPGVPESKSGKLAGGPMLGIAPSLNREMGNVLEALARENGIPFQYEVMGGEAGTNADVIGVSRAGVRCAMLSIPQRNMHTPAEIVDLQDLEHTAQLIAAYVRRAG